MDVTVVDVEHDSRVHDQVVMYVYCSKARRPTYRALVRTPIRSEGAVS